ncbi:MAG: hypothetical protein C0608_02130 [Deltaproteobacteria bacterium]|nr:MAG: hypothetical protein C0608_02130 [Deltaproteobacteria bacterium]
MLRVILFCILFSLFPLSWASSAELVIGLIPEQNVFAQLERYEPLGKYISSRLGMPVRFSMLSRYGNIIESFRKKELNAAFWGSFTGALAIAKEGVEPIARPVWLDDSSTYYGLVFVRKDSGYESFKDLEGKRIAFVDKATTAGYVSPLFLLREQGVDKPPEDYFREVIYTGSHDAAILAVLNGEADVGAAKNTIYTLEANRNKRVEEELKLIGWTQRVPSNALGVSSDFPKAEARRLKEILIGMNDSPEGLKVLESFKAKKFIETTKDDYVPVFEMADKAGIELSTYDYFNK